MALLLAIAIFPLVPRFTQWWEKNRNRLFLSCLLASITCLYYVYRGHGIHGSAPGLETLGNVLKHAVLGDYVPFIVLLFSLYVISGGIRISGDIPAYPLTNVVILLIGSMLASVLGTTGASMLLIRPLLQINSERKHVTHTVVFFIFLVSNIGGLLLPIGDPPLFLGYLRGVPFLWTISLWPLWFVCLALVLGIYWIIDFTTYRSEQPRDIKLDELVRVPIRMGGLQNVPLLLGVILSIALFVPGKRLVGTEWVIPAHLYLRECVQLALAGLSLLITSKTLRKDNNFNFHAINEVAVLFIGIFITMQVPVEILKIQGVHLGLHSPLQFFWFTGILSSFLDNAPTYVVFFETAGTLPLDGEAVIRGVATATGTISEPLLVAISCGAVFMGAMTYIGNGPNFLVRSIAQSHGVRMPSFLGYMGYSVAILTPPFIIISIIFF